METGRLESHYKPVIACADRSFLGSLELKLNHVRIQGNCIVEVSQTHRELSHPDVCYEYNTNRHFGEGVGGGGRLCLTTISTSSLSHNKQPPCTLHARLYKTKSWVPSVLISVSTETQITRSYQLLCLSVCLSVTWNSTNLFLETVKIRVRWHFT